MTDFISFAQAHGLIIKNIQYDKWVRVPTTDKPNNRNGSYIYRGDFGVVRNWALQGENAIWFGDRDSIDPKKLYEMRRKNEIETKKRRQEAAKKAAGMMKSASKAKHPYLTKKGFPEQTGWVWKELLLIPMRVGQSLVGCQTIDQEGKKKFLYGQQTKGACSVFDNKGVDIYCEGYATALSIRRALKHARKRYRIIVCFSADNMKHIASGKSGFVVADADAVGLRAANNTSLPYWYSDVEGEDFNDYEARVGLQVASDSLVGWMNRNKS